MPISQRNRSRLWLALTASGLATLLLVEIATRLLTHTNPENGMPMVGSVPLLPYRPEPDAVRAWIARTKDATYVAPDADLGWCVQPSGKTLDGRYESNPQAARARQDRVYAAKPPDGKLRLVAVGDSFTHGDQVANDETWPYRLEALRPDLETVNLGVPGYGTDQAFLRWQRDGVRFRPDLVVLGIWPENICRNLNVVRYFLQPASGFSAKPRFVATAHGLERIDSPVLSGDALVAAVTDPDGAALLANDYWARVPDPTPRPLRALRLARVAATVYDLYHRRRMRERLYSGDEPSGIDVTVAIAEAFRSDVEARGAIPLVVLIPMRDLLETYPEPDSLPLARALRARGVDPIDLGPAMTRVVREKGVGCCYRGDGHLTAQGNDLVAHWLAERLAPQLDAAARGRTP